MYLNVQMNKNNAYVHANTHTQTSFRPRQSFIFNQQACSEVYHSVSQVEINCCPLATTVVAPSSLGPYWPWGSDTAAPCLSHFPGSSSTAEPVVSTHPRWLLLDPLLVNSIPVSWVAYPGCIGSIPGCLLNPCLPLSDLSQHPADFISSIHLESTHSPPCALSLKAKDFWWVFLAAPSVEFSTNVTLCFSDLLPLPAVL